MRALTWTPVTSILAIFLTSPFLTFGQIKHDCHVTREQIEEAVKRFPEPSGLNATVQRVLDCLRDCDRNRRSLVIKEIQLRLQFRDTNETCTSSDGNYSLALYEADYGSASYGAWQDEILKTGLTFCNPFKHLVCSPISKKCECRLGTIWFSFASKCSTILGGYCWIPGVASRNPDDIQPSLRYPRIFNPFADRRFNFDYDEITRSLCLTNSRNRCTFGLKLFLNNICADDALIRLDQNFEFDFKKLPRLNFGDSCNLDHHTQLFTTTEAEVLNYTIRVKNLEAIQKAKTQFCDHKALHLCGSEGKCECIKPTIYNSETKFCTFRSPHELCQEESTFEKLVNNFPGWVREEMLSGFEISRKRECPVGCFDVQFPNGVLVEPNSKFCFTCPNRGSDLVVSVGKNCDESLTRFLEGAPPPALPIDIPEYEKQVELFVLFNEKAEEFRRLFQLDKNSACDFEGEKNAYRIIRRIKSVELPGSIFTTQDYNDLMSSMDKHIVGMRTFCRRRLRENILPRPPLKNRPILVCGPSAVNPNCYDTINNTFYLEDLMKRLSGKHFQASDTGNCAPHPRDVIRYAEQKFKRFDKFNEDPLEIDAYEYLFNTLENHWIKNSQFCNRTGGFKCSKSLDDKSNANGECVFSQDLLKEVEAELEAERLAALGSKSCHKSIQHLLSILLFILHIILLN